MTVGWLTQEHLSARSQMFLTANRTFDKDLLKFERQGRLLSMLAQALPSPPIVLQPSFWNNLTDIRQRLFPLYVSSQKPRRTYLLVQADIVQQLKDLDLDLEKFSGSDSTHIRMLLTANDAQKMLDKIIQHLLFTDQLLPGDEIRARSLKFPSNRSVYLLVTPQKRSTNEVPCEGLPATPGQF